MKKNPEQHGFYIYGIVRAGAPLQTNTCGVDRRWPCIEEIRNDDICAVVSRVPREPIAATREHLLAHERVNRAVLADRTVIPMSFGMQCRSRQDVAELLRSGYDAFFEALEQMDGKLEFGLQGYRHGDAAAGADRAVPEILRQLGDVSLASRLNAPFGTGMVMNAAFLVQRSGAAGFDHGVREISQRYPDLMFKRSGPWPPYNFVRIRLQLERPS
jgi:gas vesicle protein GvpL/GvpF